VPRTPDDPDACPVEATDLDLKLQLSIPGSVTAVQPAVERILTTVRDTGCARGREFEVEVALCEALANAIRHGCGDDPGSRVQICVACDQRRNLVVVVRDPGPGFDPTTLPDPVEGERLLASHGRGVYLINRLVDEVRYERGGSELWMRVDSPPGEDEP
jgi:serine/threonine-protein kinase RsbW